ncbi:hypothetical protein LTH96_04875 [Nesterenkonia sp. LB17]|uniref:hypothetical protein n=1 Tax=Nesterenkonia sp. LB17 TaxID=2901230 RepID=UPI001F4CC1E4|nr:hypothetical protein [Nesterenkonia sp. LB17]MCH8565069.1 hypothetical protein [Nesterenkonia sp. LB17]
MGIFFTVFYVMQFSPAVLSEGCLEVSPFVDAVSCLALTALPRVFLRAGSGKATARSDSR